MKEYFIWFTNKFQPKLRMFVVHYYMGALCLSLLSVMFSVIQYVKLKVLFYQKLINDP